MKREELDKRLRGLLIDSMKGDKDSYETFLELCSMLLKPYLIHLGGRYAGRENTEDILQEVLVTLHKKKHTYRPDRAFLPWLYTMARHRFIDDYRAKKRLPKTTTLEYDIPLEYDGAEFDLGPVMDLLTAKQREMLLLVKVEGATYEEAAKTLHMSVPAVKVGIHRIIKFLKDKSPYDR